MNEPFTYAGGGKWVDHLAQDENHLNEVAKGATVLDLKKRVSPVWIRRNVGRDPARAICILRDYAGFDEGVEVPSVPLNQVIYNVGKKISVRIVATNKPPMIAKAIGPQNTVGAIGIMPRTVDTAVSMIGRKRELLASMAASQTLFP